jgi:hypothetical protein
MPSIVEVSADGVTSSQLAAALLEVQGVRLPSRLARVQRALRAPVVVDVTEVHDWPAFFWAISSVWLSATNRQSTRARYVVTTAIEAEPMVVEFEQEEARVAGLVHGLEPYIEELVSIRVEPAQLDASGNPLGNRSG